MVGVPAALRNLFNFSEHQSISAAMVIELVTESIEIGRGVYNSIEARKLTEDAGFDIFHATFELISMLFAVELEDGLIGSISGGEGDVGKHGYTANGVEICFAIVLWVMVTFTIIEVLSGWGPPDKGSDFAESRSDLENLCKILEGASPDPNKWSGAGADNYNKLNRDLCGLVATIKEVDQQIENILKHQAGQVQQAREEVASILGSLAALLLFVSVYATIILKDPASPTAVFLEKYVIRVVLGVTATAFLMSIAFVGVLIDEGCSNERRLRRRRNKYEDVADDADRIARGSAPVAVGGVNTPSWVSVPSFAAATLMSDMSAISLGRSAATGGMADKWASAAARSGDGAEGGNGPLTVPALAAETPAKAQTPWADLVLAGLDQPAEEAAEALWNAVGRLNLGGQTAGQVPLLASISRRPAKSGAEETAFRAAEAVVPATLAGDIDEATTASSADHAPGVPVEVAMVGRRTGAGTGQGAA